MAINFNAPAKVVTKYQTSDGFVHTCSFHVKPDPSQTANWNVVGESMAFYQLVSKDSGGGWSVQDAINQFWHGQGGLLAPDGFRTMFHTSTTFLSIALYKFATGTNTPYWLSEWDFNYSGTSILAMNPNSQHTFVGKSSEGGIAKMVFLDVGHPNSAEFVSRGSFNSNENQMVWALTHDESLIFCRDGGSWAAVRGYWGGQNEAIFKKRFRQ